MDVDKGPRFRHSADLVRAGDHLAEQGGSTAGCHVYKGQSAVTRVTDLGSQSVE